MNKLKYILPILIAIACFGLQQVKADMFSFDLTVGNAAISGNPGPYATVVVNRTDNTHATITFTSLTNAGNIYLMGGHGAVGVNVNAMSFTFGSITGSNAGGGFTPGPWSDDGAGNVDGFGSFNLVIKSFDGFGHSSDMISFTVTNTSGTWATVGDVLTPNDTTHNALAVSHIFVTTFPANARNGASVTGFASGAGAVSLPDGGTTVMLLGAALSVLGMARRYLKS